MAVGIGTDVVTEVVLGAGAEAYVGTGTGASVNTHAPHRTGQEFAIKRLALQSLSVEPAHPAGSGSPLHKNWSAGKIDVTRGATNAVVAAGGSGTVEIEVEEEGVVVEAVNLVSASCKQAPLITPIFVFGEAPAEVFNKHRPPL